jgi:hypothetical protein
VVSILASIVLSVLPSAHAYIENARMPVCLDGSEELRVDNERVLDLKRTSKNQTLARAFIEGKVISEDHRKNDHDHFVISIGPGKDDTLEIIYNDDREFGPLGQINIGDDITVCGDYITSTARARGYDPSPQGAIVHWIHYNPGDRSDSHEHGFVMLRGSTLVGFDEAPDAAWDGKIVRGSGGGKRPKQRNFGDGMDGEDPCESEIDCAASF